MKKYFGKLGALALLILALSSCSTPKDITYMQGLENGQTQTVPIGRRFTAQPDDQLSIVVTSRDPRMADMFNLAISQKVIGYSVGTGSISPATAHYTVNPDGTIIFPVLGAINVQGKTRSEIAAEIQSKIQAKDLLKDAVVTVDFLSAKVAVLGDVGNPGEYQVDRDNITILQALAKAGDLNITGLRENVLVLRQENGKDVAYRVNLLNTQELMTSPAYYLQQNDVIYVEPNDTKKRQSTANGNTVLTPTFWLSVTSVLTTIAVLIVK